MAARHPFELLARHLIGAAGPLIRARNALGDFQQLMRLVGFEVTSLPAAFANLGNAVTSATVKIDTKDGSLDLDGATALLADAKAIFDGIRGLSAAPAPAGVNAAEF